MKITVDNLSEMFEGTKQLLIGSAITAIAGTFIFIRISEFEVKADKIPLMMVVLFLLTVIAGFYAMLFTPLTKLTAKIFDIKSSIVLCRIFTVIYFVIYAVGTLFLAIFIVSSFMYMHNEDYILTGCFAIGCLIIAVIQTRKSYRLISQ